MAQTTRVKVNLDVTLEMPGDKTHLKINDKNVLFDLLKLRSVNKKDVKIKYDEPELIKTTPQIDIRKRTKNNIFKNSKWTQGKKYLEFGHNNKKFAILEVWNGILIRTVSNKNSYPYNYTSLSIIIGENGKVGTWDGKLVDEDKVKQINLFIEAKINSKLSSLSYNSPEYVECFDAIVSEIINV